MEPQSGIKTWQWVVTVVVIIALIIIGIMVFGSKKPTTEPTTNETPITNETPTATNSIIMSDQFPGNVVYISSVQAAQPVWVAIHKDANGLPGDVIGQAKFAVGTNPGKITLKEPTVDGKTYYAVMHTDDGNTTFDVTTDVPLKDANGNTIMKVFHASSSANAEIKG